MNSLQLLTGGIGCDLVTGTNAFAARKGYIAAVVVNEDSTGITHVKEMLNGTATTVTVRSYLGTNTLKENKLIVFDFPVSEIKLAAGSVWVFYMPGL